MAAVDLTAAPASASTRANGSPLEIVPQPRNVALGDPGVPGQLGDGWNVPQSDRNSAGPLLPPVEVGQQRQRRRGGGFFKRLFGG